MKPAVAYQKILVDLATLASGYSGKNTWPGPKEFTFILIQNNLQ